MARRTAIIFDMDGLMVDTEPLSYQAWMRLLAPHGCVLDEETYSKMIGRRSSESAQIVIEAYDLPVTATELLHRKEAIFAEIRAQGVPPMPGLWELHEEIARRSVPWGVATSSPRRHADLILAQLNLSGSCCAIAAGDEVAHGKPAPDLYLLAADRLGVAPEQCVALEDSAPGCQSAAAAGMLTVAVPSEQTRSTDLRSAHFICNSLHEVLANLDLLLG